MADPKDNSGSANDEELPPPMSSTNLTRSTNTVTWANIAEIMNSPTGSQTEREEKAYQYYRGHGGDQQLDRHRFIEEYNRNTAPIENEIPTPRSRP